MKAQDLKKSILQYAMEGKLVAQDPTDEPASELLKRIKAEKERLIKEGKIKKEKPLPPITRDEIPYELPQGWEWVRLGNISLVNGGYAFKSSDYKNIGIRVVRISDFNELGFVNNTIVRYDYNSKLDDYLLEEKNIILCMTGGTVGKSLFIKKLAEPMVTNQRVGTIKILGVIEDYINYSILSPLIQQVITESKNSTNDNISIATIKHFLIPIPPLAEQKRIVEKLEEILPLAEEYGRNEEILSEMNQKLPKQIRQSILQYAVQGKLVKQNPQDEPATELLKHIKAEKERLIKDGKIKKEKPLPPITQDEIPYELPQGWVWTRLGDFCSLNPRNIADDDINAGFIPMSHLKDGYNNEHSFEIKKWKDIKKGFTHFKNGDIVIAKITPCFQNRKSAIIKNLPNNIGAGTTELHVIREDTNILIKKYLLLIFKTELFIKNGIKNFTGTAGQQRIGKDYIANYLIPLPPLAEQMRIVAKVDELMKYADKLEEVPSNIIKIRESKDTEINSKNNKVDITKAINKRAILNAKIIEKFNNNNMFSAISDEKLIFITEKVLELPLEGKYKKAAAGPLDKKARNEVKKIFKELNWFDVIEGDSGQKEQYIPLDNLCEYNDLYNKCFSNKSQEIDRVLNLFTGQNLSKAEPVATLYAVWNNLLIDNKECSDETIIKGFYVWSNRKARYNKNDLLDLLVWMRYHNLIPEGKGEKITV